MMKKLSLSFVFVLLAFAANAQSNYNLVNPELWVFGTSSLHDWEMQTTDVQGGGAFVIEEGKLISATGVKIEFAVETLESGKSLLNRNARKALDYENTPNISFVVKEIRTNSAGKTEAVGDFTAKGSTKEMVFELDYTVNGNSIDVEGESSFKMTHFGIKPPTALAGTIKTDEEVKIEFYLTFEKG